MVSRYEHVYQALIEGTRKQERSGDQARWLGLQPVAIHDTSAGRSTHVVTAGAPESAGGQL